MMIYDQVQQLYGFEYYVFHCTVLTRTLHWACGAWLASYVRQPAVEVSTISS